LVAFGEWALRHFIYLERPEGLDLDDAEGADQLSRTTGLGPLAALGTDLHGMARDIESA
jgi:hypothetical protein